MSKNRGKLIFSMTIFRPFGPKMFLCPLVTPAMPTLFSSHRHEPNDHRHALRVQHHVVHTTIAAHALCARQTVHAHTHAYVVTSVCMCVLIFRHTFCGFFRDASISRLFPRYFDQSAFAVLAICVKTQSMILFVRMANGLRQALDVLYKVTNLVFHLV